MKKQVASTLLLLLLLSLPAWSYKIGIGFNANKTLLLPLRLTDGFMLELSYKRRDSTEDQGTSFISKSYSALGVGFLRLMSAKNKIEHYYGLRISAPSYEKQKKPFPIVG